MKSMEWPFVTAIGAQKTKPANLAEDPQKIAGNLCKLFKLLLRIQLPYPFHISSKCHAYQIFKLNDEPLTSHKKYLHPTAGPTAGLTATGTACCCVLVDMSDILQANVELLKTYSIHDYACLYKSLTKLQTRSD